MSSGIIETGLSGGALDVHRALASLQEELEAIDYYHQRAEVTVDASLKGVLLHNRDEEVEHAVMALEWLRRSLPVFDRQLRALLFQPGDIAAHGEDGAEPSPGPAGRGLGLGNLQRGHSQGGGHDRHAPAPFGAHHG